MGFRSFLACAVLLLLSVPAGAQTTAQRDLQAALLLQSSLAELSHGTPIQDVTLTGNVRRVAGSLDESGNITLQGTVAGQSRVDVLLPSGERRQVRDVSTEQWTGSWSGADGTWHRIAGQNLSTDPTWFFPAFLMAGVLSNTGYAIAPAKTETLAGTKVECVAAYQEYDGSQKLPSLLQKLSRTKICFDSQNLLPVAVEFSTHPNNDALTNIPVRILFSDYRTAEGDAIPYHIRKYVHDGLVLDVTISNVQFNTGLSSPDFEAQ